ncbi:MAG: zinc ribbon domain-containing protein [Bacteroidaceae bacterium]|nr:zinc ribbon domain-containing protein [Bacteroidaceae bacterium]
MSTFTTKKRLYGNPSQIPAVANYMVRVFQAEGYEVCVENLNNGCEIYITKGGLFKAVLGLKTALKVTLKPTSDGNISIATGVSLFKRQLIPTIVALSLFKPVFITQIWGLIKQAKLDDKAVSVAEAALLQLT